jgi:hypothetical protein
METIKPLHMQKFRFTIDVEVSITDYPKALMDNPKLDNRYLTTREEDPSDFREWMEFQKRLLHSVINNPNILSELVKQTAGIAAAEYLSARYMSSSNESSLEELLLPVINHMSADDKKRIDSAITNGVLMETVEAALFDSFRATVFNTDTELLE